MSKADLLKRYVTLAEEKARIEESLTAAKVALFEAHGYAHCLPGDPRRAGFDQDTRDQYLAYKLGPGHYTKEELERARKEYASWVDNYAKRYLQRPMVLMPSGEWRIVSEAWQHLWRAIPKLVHLVDRETSP